MIAQRTDVEASATPVYSDAYIEDRAEEFCALSLADQGVSLLQFLADPERYRRAAGLFRPLLPEQRTVQQRLDAEADAAEAEALRACPDAECRGGAYIKPLHHHSYGNRSPQCDFRRRRTGGAQ